MKWLYLFLVFVLLWSCSSTDVSPPDPIDENPPPPNENVIVLNSIWESEMPAFLPQGMVYDELERPYLFLAAKAGGLLILNDNGDNQPTQVANIPIEDLDMLHVMNIYQKGNYLYLALGDFFDGQNGATAGMAIINVTDPINAFIEDIWKSETVLAGSAIVIVDGNYAYLGAMEFGLYIFDVSDPSTIIEKSNYLPNIDYPVEDPDDLQIPNARGMDIVGNNLYLCYDAGGIRIIDVSNKELPDEIGQFHNFAAIENTPKAYNNIIIDGNLAYCAVDYCGFEIWDISTLGEEELIGWWNPWDCDTLNNLWWNSPGHSNQMTYDAENNLIFVNTGRSDLSVLDVSDPENPELVASHGDFEDNLATWGMTSHNNDIYLLYIEASVPLYSNWSGLKKLNWSFE